MPLIKNIPYRQVGIKVVHRTRLADTLGYPFYR
jgi:hypothetical protein